MWTRNLCSGELWHSILLPARRPASGAKEHEPCSKFKEGSCLACSGVFQWEWLHSVACTGLVERAKWGTLFLVIDLCIFLQKKLKMVSLRPLIPSCDWCAHLTFHWKCGRVKEGQHFLLLSCSISFKDNKLCGLFSFLRSCPLPFVKPCYFRSSFPFQQHSSACVLTVKSSLFPCYH